ncbi:MAG: hypothetical protein Q8K29_07080 [Polaromonas sp.]|nr:hypothetical protein [Polaromonas sp.]
MFGVVAQYKAEIAGVHRAFMVFADPRDHGRMEEIGSSPVMLGVLAKLSKEIQEAGGILAGADSAGLTSVRN